MSLSHQRLLEVLDYCPDTGVFRWKIARGRAGRGTVAGRKSWDNTKKRRARLQIQIDGQLHAAHRLAWFYMLGQWPSNELDHKNQDPLDNRWCNLREASRTENQYNLPRRSDNTSGVPGVRWHSFAQKWNARIHADGQEVHLGLFADFDEAVRARQQAEGDIYV